MATTPNDSFLHVDLTGKVIIKAKLGDDIRCIPIHNEDITYDELVLMMQRVFSGKLSSTDEITIKYKDEDGDLITMTDSSDLAFALHRSKILKITIFVNGKLKPIIMEDLDDLRRVLMSVKDTACKLLSSLDADRKSARSTPAPMPAVHDGQKSLSDAGGSYPMPSKGEGKEFDPLSTDVQSGPQDPSMNAGGFAQPPFAGSRSQTPSSLPSSGGSRPGSQFQPINPNQPPYSTASAANQPQQPFPDSQQQQNTGGGYPPQPQLNGGNRAGGPMVYPPPPSQGGSVQPGTSAQFRPQYPSAGNYSTAGRYPNQAVQTGLPGGQQPGMPGVQQPGMPGVQQPGMPGVQQPGMPGVQQPGMPGGQQPGMPGGQQQPGMPGGQQQQPGAQMYPNYPGYGPPQNIGAQIPGGASTGGYYPQSQQGPAPPGDIRMQSYSPAPGGQGGPNPYSRGPAQGHQYPRPHGQYPATQ